MQAMSFGKEITIKYIGWKDAFQADWGPATVYQFWTFDGPVSFCKVWELTT